ncbi:MAG: orotidine-5'-phosphate decarboxylase [Ardenticatenaceae bacterium]|nr:orotidine-5'-phosphate decarboxylase [Ardenticatenaceae bacterium]MCB8987734.1 orotidine-5'-phosphate decarboxylase [Ardenticatenaceae bacterium]
MSNREKLIVALDVPTLADMQAVVTAIGDDVTTYKVGHQLFTAAGPAALSFLKSRGKQVFLDLKLHEIPHSAAQAVRAAGRQGVDMITVHASGGRQMMQTAVAAAAEFPDLKVLALTVVTGLSDDDLAEIGFASGVDEQVIRLAKLAKVAGCQGIIAAPREIERLKTAVGDDLLIVTPGVRPAGASKDDQRRVGTPFQAIQAGAAYIIVGRPIVQASNPAVAARQIVAEIEGNGPAS